MPDSPNKDVVRALYDASAAGDLEAALSVVDPDCVWIEADVEGLPFTGTHRGHAQIRENVYGKTGEAFDEFEIDVEQILEAEGDHVLSWGRVRGRTPSGGRLDARFAHVFVVEDGQIKRLVNYHDTALWLDALDGGGS